MKYNNYLGAAAELVVARQLILKQLDVFIKLTDGKTDLVVMLPCNHLISLQVKLAYEAPTGRHSFHAGSYEGVDYYAVVWASQGVSEQVSWIPTAEITAVNHASLTDELKLWYTSPIPACVVCVERNE